MYFLCGGRNSKQWRYGRFVYLKESNNQIWILLTWKLFDSFFCFFWTSHYQLGSISSYQVWFSFLLGMEDQQEFATLQLNWSKEKHHPSLLNDRNNSTSAMLRTFFLPSWHQEVIHLKTNIKGVLLPCWFVHSDDSAVGQNYNFSHVSAFTGHFGGSSACLLLSSPRPVECKKLPTKIQMPALSLTKPEVLFLSNETFVLSFLPHFSFFPSFIKKNTFLRKPYFTVVTPTRVV